MTHKEIGEYVRAQDERQEQNFKMQAILLDGLFQQWVATQQNKPKVLKLKDVYPELFGAKKARRMTQEQRQAAELEAWTKFFMG